MCWRGSGLKASLESPPAALHPPSLTHYYIPAPPQVQSTAELQHLLSCHPQRLLVAHFGKAGCSTDEVRMLGNIFCGNQP